MEGIGQGFSCSRGEGGEVRARRLLRLFKIKLTILRDGSCRCEDDAERKQGEISIMLDKTGGVLDSVILGRSTMVRQVTGCMFGCLGRSTHDSQFGAHQTLSATTFQGGLTCEYFLVRMPNSVGGRWISALRNARGRSAESSAGSARRQRKSPF